jgi:hypothetical protein
MRLARRATLFVAFSLFTLAATAFAECAWVLWHESGSFGGPTPATWSLVYASSLEGECRAHAAQRYAEAKAGIEALKEFASPYKNDKDAKLAYDDERLSVGIIGKRGIRSQFYCLPDSVDPRGPKGK